MSEKLFQSCGHVLFILPYVATPDQMPGKNSSHEGPNADKPGGRTSTLDEARRTLDEAKQRRAASAAWGSRKPRTAFVILDLSHIWVREANGEVHRLKKRSLLGLSIALGSVSAVSILLAGCGKNFYFAGRNLPPSQLTNRVMIAVQNPGLAVAGSLQIVDGFYDIRHSFNNAIASFSISGYSGKLPTTIENLPEEQAGRFTTRATARCRIDYSAEKQTGDLRLAVLEYFSRAGRATWPQPISRFTS
jgi:hypothetical protein